ncbi:MAG: periplasmic heavy metal sensor [Candidatus Omnitrophica bacterium]|nr:periplasmic heavy metal sensor [Candidatus Omnitrophota bacterium]
MPSVKKILFCFLSSSLLMAVPLALAQDAPGHEGHFPNARMEKRIHEVFNQLGLTEEQKKELQANKEKYRPRIISERRQMRAVMEALRKELMKPRLNMARIHQLHNRTKDLMSQMEDDRLTSILAVRVILTQEQFTKFVNLMDRFKHERHEK